VGIAENKRTGGRPSGHPGSDYSVLKESEPHYKALRDGHLLFGPLKAFSHKIFERGLKERRVLDWRKNGEKMS
jgi:hypothetical protein